MRRRIFSTSAVLLLVLATACAPSPVIKELGDGELVLELGAGHRSFAASLRSLGVTLLPPKNFQEVQLVEPEPNPVGPGSKQAEKETDKPPPKELPLLPPPVDPGFFEVTLQQNQTLIDLAKKYLGSGAKFTEILRANGFSEADAKRLKAGRKIKIPKVKKPG